MYGSPLLSFLLVWAGMQASTDGRKPSVIPACSQVIRRHGELSELIMFTANVTGGPGKPRPDDWPSADTVSIKEWQCPEGDKGRDFRFHRGNRNWRMLTFPKGFAEYKNVESGVADQFDRVVDSFCCKAIN